MRPYQRILHYRQINGLNQSEMAKLTGVTTQYISALESGTRPIGIKIAHRLNKVDPDHFSIIEMLELD